MRFFISFGPSSALLLILGTIVCHASAEEQVKFDAFSKASCNLAAKLLQSQSMLKEGNVILSPSSIGVLLAILQQGARENTAKELEKVLQMSAEDSKIGHGIILKSLEREKANVTLEWGNRAYVRPGFEITVAFNDTIRESFGAIVEELNFVEPSPQEAAKAINKWIQEATHGNILNFIHPSILTADTVLVLLNAVFFKGLWDLPFKKTLTKTENFELSPNNSVPVEFMSQKERFIAGEDPDSGVEWVDLPFKDEQFSMLFILPKEKHNLAKVSEKLNGELLRNIIDDVQTRQVTLHVPKFKLEEKVLVSKALEELGLKDVFTADANLEGIGPNFKNLGVSKMIHQASLEIDEDGGTASAATGVVIEYLSFPKASDHLVFRADHPFLFFLLDRINKVPLFAGRVVDPRREVLP